MGQPQSSSTLNIPFSVFFDLKTETSDLRSKNDAIVVLQTKDFLYPCANLYRVILTNLKSNLASLLLFWNLAYPCCKSSQHTGILAVVDIIVYGYSCNYFCA